MKDKGPILKVFQVKSLVIIVLATGIITFIAPKMTPKSINYNNHAQSQNVEKSNNFDNSETPYIYNTLNLAIPENYIGETITFTEAERKIFEQYIDSQSTEYAYSDLLQFEEILQRYEKVKNEKVKTHTKNILADGQLTVEKLLTSVKANNDEFLNRPKQGYGNDLFTKPLDEKDLRTTVDIIVTYVNKLLEENPNLDRNEIGCVLGDLKIFNSSNINNGSVNNDNLMLLSPNIINVSKAINKNEHQYRDVVVHEVIHLVQKNCKDQEHQKVGISYKWDDAKINSLWYRWFYEAEAEVNMASIANSVPNTYKPAITYLKSVNYATLLDKNVNANTLDKISLNDGSDGLGKLFKQYNATDIKSKKEILSMMYAIEIIQTDSNNFKKLLPEFNEVYKEKYGHEIEEPDHASSIKNELRASIGQTWTKNFYKNMANAITNANATLEDIFFLMTSFESNMNQHLTLTDQARIEKNQSFITKYVEIQNNFFELIASKNNYKVEELQQKFSEYSYTTKSKEKNYELKWLPKDKIERAEEIKNNTEKNRVKTIYNLNNSKEKAR